MPRSDKFSCQRKTGNLAQCQQSAAGLGNSVSVPLYIEMTSVSYTYTYNNQYFSIHSNVALENYGGPEGSHMQIKNSTCKLKFVHANYKIIIPAN